jgi:hypothetical protein
VVADGGGVESRVNACEKDDEVFGGEIRDNLLARGEELSFGGFPRSGRSPFHRRPLLRHPYDIRHEAAWLAPRTQKVYVKAVQHLAEYYRRSPDRLSEEDLRDYFPAVVLQEAAIVDDDRRERLA